MKLFQPCHTGSHNLVTTLCRGCYNLGNKLLQPCHSVVRACHKVVRAWHFHMGVVYTVQSKSFWLTCHQNIVYWVPSAYFITIQSHDCVAMHLLTWAIANSFMLIILRTLCMWHWLWGKAGCHYSHPQSMLGCPVKPSVIIDDRAI